MLKRYLILLFFIICSQLNGQIYISFEPVDMGIGGRVDVRSFYGTMTKGEYKFPDGNYIKKHTKLSVGRIFYLKETNRQSNLTAGIVYHKYVGSSFGKLNPYSVELGTGCRLGKVAVALRMDPLKWEGVVDVGYNF